MARRLTMNSNKINKKFKEALREFIKHGRLKNLTDNTLSYYEESLDVFVKYYGKEDFKLNEIDITVVENYIINLKQSGIKDVSVNTRLKGLRAFLYWCMKRGYMDEYKIKLIKQEEVIKETYTDGELKLLIEKPNVKKCTFTDYRNWVMVNFLLGTGVRVSTLVSILIKDIDLLESILRTRYNKNRRQQIVPISRTLNKILIEYLEYRSAESEENVLFCNMYGEKLTVDACMAAIRSFGKKRGVNKCGAHKFRHTFAKNWILAGGDVFRLQKILGHSSMDIVRKYVNIYGRDLQKDFDRFNVLDRLSDNKDYIKMR